MTAGIPSRTSADSYEGETVSEHRKYSEEKIRNSEIDLGKNPA